MPSTAHRLTAPMVPADMFCFRDECPLRGLTGRGNVIIHSQRQRRYRCTACGVTFAETRGTPFFRRRHCPKLITQVVTLLAYGCPTQAIVRAFDLDERTVAQWHRAGGEHSAGVHTAIVAQRQVELGHVQADELWVKLCGRKLWLAHAIAVPFRLWLGGVVGPRDGDLISDLVCHVRACAKSSRLLVCVDGLASYVGAFRRRFQETVPRAGERGRPRQQLPSGFLLGQVIKEYARRRMSSVRYQAVFGTLQAITARVRQTGGGRVINTAFIERLNATFRARMSSLVRRGRCLARQTETLRTGMYLVGTVYNFCDEHASLRCEAEAGAGSRWQSRTPAMSAGLTTHVWTVEELLRFRVPPPPWRPPKRRGRRPKEPSVYRWKLRPNRVTPMAPTL